MLYIYARQVLIIQREQAQKAKEERDAAKEARRIAKEEKQAWVEICCGIAELIPRQRDNEVKRKEEAMAKQKKTLMSFFKKPVASAIVSRASPAGPSSRS